jgi:hypothetical protein
MSLFKNKMRRLYSFLCTAVVLPIAASAQVKVSFSQPGQTVKENASVFARLELSEPSLLEVKVPYRVAARSNAVAGTDFKIPEDDEDDDFFNESPIVFSPGQTQRFIRVDMLPDDIQQGNLLLVLEMDEAGLLNALPGDRRQHELLILDDDPVSVYFDRHTRDYGEAGNIGIPVTLSAPLTQDLEVHFTRELVSLGAADLDLSNSLSTPSPLVIPAGATMGTIVFVVVNDSITDRNAGGADRESMRVTLTEAKLKGTSTVLSVDTQSFEAFVVDNDPIQVEFSFREDLEQPFKIQEYESATIQLVLTDADGKPTVAASEIKVPVSYGGTASRGNGDAFDYRSDEDVFTIPAGQSSYSFSIRINNDDVEDGDKTLELGIGNPSYANGGDVVAGEQRTMSFVIIDNDPISLSFGAVYSKDDAAAAEDDSLEDVLYVPSAGAIAAESWGEVSIPYFLSSISARNVEFDLQIVGSGSSATLFDVNKDAASQQWDYAITSHAIGVVDKTVRVILRAGMQEGSVIVRFNNDAEDAVIYGEPAGPTVEADETVKLRISNLNTDSSKVNLGDFSEHTLVIKDVPDIDVTHLIDGLSPDPRSLVNGKPRFNEETALFDVGYRMRWKQSLDAANFAGYRSLKVRFRTANYDVSRPDHASNDPLVELPDEAIREKGDPFDFFVDSPFNLRFATNRETLVLHEGVEPKDNKYDVTTADTIELMPYFLRPLNLPKWNDFEAPVLDAFELSDPMDWTFSFYSKGLFEMPIERIDPASDPKRMRVFLTAEVENVSADDGTPLSIHTLEPQSDGSMLLVINVGLEPQIQLQYLEPGQKWRAVHPSVIETGSPSFLHWVDQGPPMTRSHPSTVPFRLYRVISLSQN